MLKGLDILDLDDQHVALLGGLDLEGAGEVVDLGQVDVLHVVGAVVVADLAARPVDAFDLCSSLSGCCIVFRHMRRGWYLDDLAILDLARERHWID